MSYSLSLTGHKDDASEEDLIALEGAVDQLVETITGLGFSASGSLGGGGDRPSRTY